MKGRDIHGEDELGKSGRGIRDKGEMERKKNNKIQGGVR